ncbi:dihydroneopterin aldolase [Luteococcus sanguinis]|uniref:7,8-dihydroneopterin aldolase n=1 Tax=Luteococcus sanguinis TaxID=174038 RepID=A0ABW1X1S4_9ACTN
MLDWITIRGLRAFGFHGVFAEERRDGQEFIIDLRLGLAVHTDSDELPDTVDYSRISAEVIAIVQSDPVNLIETLAGRIANHCLTHELVEVAQVTVHKPHAPMDLAFDDVSVDITRSKP